MTIIDSKRLFDITTRHQIYIERVKLGQSREFNVVLFELKQEIEKLLRQVKYKTLDGLTKAQLNKLITSLRDSQLRIYSKYTSGLLEQLKDFMRVDLEVSRITLASAKQEIDLGRFEQLTDEESISYMSLVKQETNAVPFFGMMAATGVDKLWSNVVNAPIPANGIYLVPFVKGFAVSAQASVEHIIRKAYVNGWTIEETIDAITDTSKQGSSSQLQKLAQQAAAVSATATQHVGQLVALAVGSALFASYGWFSVMDGKTTEICVSRNNKVYRYGAGPIPPAHIKCRSHIAPIVGSSGIFAAESFYTWMKDQPEDLQDDFLGEELADELRNGNLKAKDLPKYEASRPLSLKEFRDKVKQILTR